jgi:hypothetical protein
MTDSALGLDIDGVITACPEFFSSLSNRWVAAGRQVHIVSSRSDQMEARQATINELRALGIMYDRLYLLPSIEIAKQRCLHANLDWYQKYIWQKVEYCLKQGIGIFYDDDEKVVELFRLYAPGIQIVHYGCGDNEVDINIQRKV